jgi:hypothetical protein
MNLIYIIYIIYNMNFLGRFSIKARISSSVKIRPVGAKSFHADEHTDTYRQTDTAKTTAAFRIFANAPKTEGHEFANTYRLSQG